MIRFKTTALSWALLLGSALADTCSQIDNAYSSCQLSSMCSQCIAASGCEYNLMDGTCTSAVASNTSTTYCSASDSVCSSCTVSSAKPTCTGEDGSCICPSLCDIVSSEDCSSSNNGTGDSPKFSMLYLVVAFGALGIMIMLYMQRRCKEKRREHHISLVRQEMESRREQRQREREYLRSRRPELALDLGTWRESVETHKPQMSKVELETCYYLMVQNEKKKDGKKNSDYYDSASDGKVKVGIGAITSPDASRVSDPTSLQSPLPSTAPYVAMREEYPSNTTTDGSDSGSEIASVVGEDEDEDKPEIAIDVDHSAARSPVGSVSLGFAKRTKDTTSYTMRSLGVTIPESSTCSHISTVYSECNVQTMCSLCISTGTCEFDVASLLCKTKSATSVNDTETTYCSSNDTVCSACNATAADPICTGEDGICICQSLCSMIEPFDTSDCTSNEVSIIAYIGVAVGMVCVASCVFMMVTCRKRCIAAVRQRSFRHESEQLRMRQPQLALDLIGWRGTVELNKPELHKLGACCYVMKQEERPNPTGAVAEIAVAVEEGEPSTSLETDSTYSNVEFPRSSRKPEAVSSPRPNNYTGECDFNDMDDSVA